MLTDEEVTGQEMGGQARFDSIAQVSYALTVRPWNPLAVCAASLLVQIIEYC